MVKENEMKKKLLYLYKINTKFQMKNKTIVNGLLMILLFFFNWFSECETEIGIILLSKRQS